jgi:hypothetical protein
MIMKRRIGSRCIGESNPDLQDIINADCHGCRPRSLGDTHENVKSIWLAGGLAGFGSQVDGSSFSPILPKHKNAGQNRSSCRSKQQVKGPHFTDIMISRSSLVWFVQVARRTIKVETLDRRRLRGAGCDRKSPWTIPSLESAHEVIRQ